jgi:hypothetical protein
MRDKEWLSPGLTQSQARSGGGRREKIDLDGLPANLHQAVGCCRSSELAGRGILLGAAKAPWELPVALTGAAFVLSVGSGRSRRSLSPPLFFLLHHLRLAPYLYYCNRPSPSSSPCIPRLSHLSSTPPFVDCFGIPVNVSGLTSPTSRSSSRT